MKWGRRRTLWDLISLTARPRALFQRQRQAVFPNVDLTAILTPTQFLEQREQGIFSGGIRLRCAGGAHGRDVFVAGDVAHQEFIVAEAWAAELAAQLFDGRLGRLPLGELFRT